MRQRQFDIITIGDTCVDLIMSMGDIVPRFGQVEQWVPDYFVEMGGSTCIFACQAAKLGLRTAVLGRVGEDLFGRLIMQRLEESGVDTRYITIDARLKTGMGISMCKPDGDRAILTFGGSLNAVYPSDVSDDFLNSGRHLHYGSYYLQTNLLSVAPSVLRRAHELGLTTSLDTNWDPSGNWKEGLDEMLGSTDIFFPNEQEALAISGAATLAEAAERLGQSVAVVAIKRGDKGALIQTGKQRFVTPVEPVDQLVDTIGAGDSFDAGFLAGWLNALSPAECAAIGNACGRATTLAQGGIAGQLRREVFPQLYNPVPGASL
jgi:ribokinase